MPRSAVRLALALLITFLALAGTLLSGATPAYAHAVVVRTEPADGAVLGGPPRQASQLHVSLISAPSLHQ